MLYEYPELTELKFDIHTTCYHVVCIYYSVYSQRSFFIKIPQMFFLPPAATSTEEAWIQWDCRQPWSEDKQWHAAHTRVDSTIICTCQRLTFSAPGINEVALTSTRVQSNIIAFVRSAVQAQPRASVFLYTAWLQQGSCPKAVWLKPVWITPVH